MKPDGTNRKQLTDNSEDDRAPDISPDGKRIAFTRNGDSLQGGKRRLRGAQRGRWSGGVVGVGARLGTDAHYY